MYSYYKHYSSWAGVKQSVNYDDFSVIHLSSLASLSFTELTDIKNALSQFNYVVYDYSQNNLEQVLQDFSSQLGLTTPDKHLCVNEDKVTKIFDDNQNAKSFYIPYTNKPINWHTDGYYNSQQQKVYSFILHCATPAYEGGVNSLLDPDQVFIYLMQQNPLYIEALMQPNVMTIPENRKDGELMRAETSTAIFEVINQKHDVLMRYSMRKKNIIFAKDSLTQEALSCMDEFINSSLAPSISLKLKAGQGVLCNNVLHKRTAFMDKEGMERLYYRARYYNRIYINI